MDFHKPTIILHLFWIMPLVLLAIWYAGMQRRRRLATFAANADIAADLTTSVSPGRRRMRNVLFIAGVVLIVAAAARPYWGSRLIERRMQSRDVMIVLDTSRSMLAKDVLPSRMQHARLFIRNLVAMTPGDRYGLIAFAGTAFPECPLTEDRSGFLLFLDDIDTDSIPVGGTNIEIALREALKAFEGAEGGNRGVVLITDGDELDGDFTSVLEEFADRSIPIFVVGIGDPTIGTFIQLEDNTFIKDKNGDRVKTRLNQAGLQKLAAAVGGTYVHSSAVHDGLDHTVAAVRGLVPEHQTQNTVSRPIKRYQVPLFLGMLCLLVRLLIGERRRAPAVRPAVVAAALLCITPPSPAQDVPPGPVSVAAPATELATEDPVAPVTNPAIEALERRLETAATDREKAFIYHNMGVNYRAKGDLESAERAFEDALTIGSQFPEIRAGAYQNLGVMRHELAREQTQADPDTALAELSEARSYYREALRADPGRKGLAENQERALYDKVTIEQIKELMKQFQDQHQDAQDKTGEAKEAQEQANAEQQPGDKQQKQQEASEKSEAAEQSLRDLADQAEQQGMEQAAEQIRQAADQVQQARGDQQQAMDQQRPEQQRSEAGEAAEDKLADAHKMMGGEGEQEPQQGDDQQQTADNNDQQDGKQEDGDSQDQEDGQDGQDQDAQQAQDQVGGETDGQQTAAATPTEEDVDFDREQAVRILEDMQRQEHDLKRRMKQVQAQRRSGKVERDW